MKIEVWRHAFPFPGQTADLAQRTEAAGWDGLAVADSQNLVADPYVELALAAHQTRTLRLGTAVTNLVTRDPAVTASSILSVHAESGGRALLGVARGDSALGFLGLSSTPTPAFRDGLGQLRAYLDGLPVERHGFSAPISWPSTLGLPKLPLDVHATGPEVISLAAVIADRLTVAVGAQPDWVRWAMATARHAREAAGLDPDQLQIGLFLMAAAAPNPAQAATLVRGNVAIFAHIAGRGRALPDCVPERQRAVINRVMTVYAEAEHGANASKAAAELPDEFVQWFSATGTSDQVIDRLTELAALGLNHLVIVGPSRDADPTAVRAALERFDDEVLPALRKP